DDAADELDRADDVARDGYGEPGPGLGPDEHLPPRERDPIEARYGPDGPKEVDERRQVVDADIEDRARTHAEELGGRRVEDLRSTIDEGDRETDGLPDPAAVDLGPGRLERAAQERVRGAADRDAGSFGARQDRLSRAPIDREWLLAVDVPAFPDRRQADRRMDGHRRQVQDDVDVRVAEQGAKLERTHPGHRRERRRPCRVGVGAGDEANA